MTKYATAIASALAASLDTERDAYIEAINAMVRAVVAHSPTGIGPLVAPAGERYYQRLLSYQRDLSEAAWKDLSMREAEAIFEALEGSLPIHPHTYPIPPGLPTIRDLPTEFKR